MTGDRGNLLTIKAIPRRFLVPLCNQFHLETASNHSPTGQVSSSNWLSPGVGWGGSLTSL